jgi:hypothetical protein
LTVDPALSKTHEPYVYVGDRPLASTDPTGECAVARAAALNSTAEECHQLLGSIKGTAKVLERRLRQLIVNRRGYPREKVEKYIKSFEDRQQALRKKLKKWNLKNCTEEIGEMIPEAVWQLTEIKLRIVVRPG